MTIEKQDGRKPVLIKKYPNRRLYDTSTSSYIVLDDIVELVKSDIPFVIEDKKSGEDITRLILSQIIFEQENKSSDFHFPIQLQKQLITMYGDKYSAMIPDFLGNSMAVFLKERAKAKKAVESVVERGTKSVVEFGQTIALKNLDLFKRSLDVFDEVSGLGPKKSKDTENKDTEKLSEEEELVKQIEALQSRLISLKQKQD
ncbi:MAG: polyhydroxyalkanoate synthesis repressor PhaR [Rhizobiaceae bacterium]